MNPEHQRVYDSTPEDDPRSTLDPYKELILRWRRQGRTYRKIKALLAAELSVKVSTTRLFYFVQSRSRPRKPQADLELEPATVQPAKGRLSAEERQARLDFVRSLNSKTDLNEEQPKSGWDELEPDNVSYKPKGDK
jgi:hypothetical protein